MVKTSNLKPKNIEVGDYISYEYDPKLDKKSGKGIVKQITNHCIFVHPDYAHYKDQVETISFSEILTKEVVINRLISGQEIYYTV